MYLTECTAVARYRFSSMRLNLDGRNGLLTRMHARDVPEIGKTREGICKHGISPLCESRVSFKLERVGQSADTIVYTAVLRGRGILISRFYTDPAP